MEEGVTADKALLVILIQDVAEGIVANALALNELRKNVDLRIQFRTQMVRAQHKENKPCVRQRCGDCVAVECVVRSEAEFFVNCEQLLKMDFPVMQLVFVVKLHRYTATALRDAWEIERQRFEMRTD